MTRARDAAVAHAPDSQSPPRILLVEDELVVALDLASSLEECGYEVTRIVDSGEGALQAAEQDPPDVVLMDITIRGRLDGIETATLLKARRALPVVYVTAYADGPIRERAEATRPAAYLTKPFTPVEVERALQAALAA